MNQDDELDIKSPSPPPKPIPPPRLDLWSPMRSPAFWRGAIRTRHEVSRQADSDYERAAHVEAIHRLETIVAAVEAGRKLDPATFPELARWLAY